MIHHVDKEFGYLIDGQMLSLGENIDGLKEELISFVKKVAPYKVKFEPKP